MRALKDGVGGDGEVGEAMGLLAILLLLLGIFLELMTISDLTIIITTLLNKNN